MKRTFGILCDHYAQIILQSFLYIFADLFLIIYKIVISFLFQTRTMSREVKQLE